MLPGASSCVGQQAAGSSATPNGLSASLKGPTAAADGDNDVGDYIGGGTADADVGGSGGGRAGRGGGRGGGGALAGLGGMLGYRPKKQSILTRIGDLSRFQTSTKIEVGKGLGVSGPLTQGSRNQRAQDDAPVLPRRT